jgi:hypothetical protein
LFLQTVDVFAAAGSTINSYVATAIVGVVNMLATAGNYGCWPRFPHLLFYVASMAFNFGEN